MKSFLCKFTEALEAGWAGFRSTLFAPRRKHLKVFVNRDKPKGKFLKGDIWINPDESSLHIWNGKKWESLKHN